MNCEGTQIDGHDKIQHDTVSAATWYNHRKLNQPFTKRHDGAASDAKFLQSDSAPMDVLHKKMHAKLATAKACYKRNFDRTILRALYSYAGQPVFVERPPAQMTESA